jgi:hypothetical protein
VRVGEVFVECTEEDGIARLPRGEEGSETGRVEATRIDLNVKEMTHAA